jgi:uncharacterized protein
MTATIEIGQTSTGAVVSLPLRLANRHGLITGATGTGKTVTLQCLAEEFSRAGVPVFAADVKGDLSGIAAPGRPGGAAEARARALGRPWASAACPVALWDIFARQGLPIRTSVQEMGPLLLSALLKLNEAQSGALSIAFRRSEDEEEFLLNLDDLRWALNSMIEDREAVSAKYGNVTGHSIAAIQRKILALESQGADFLFGEPPFEITDLMRVDDHGRGVVNLLHADGLMEAPALYASFLLWLLTELFRRLPEAGDLERPKIAFIFDESHLLFAGAPAHLVQAVERLVRLVRSKGVAVFFVTQSPSDIPNTVLAQLGTRIQHALRAYTPADQKLIKAAVQAFRPNKAVDVRAAITSMAIGEALVSVLEADGIPSPVECLLILPPRAQIGPIGEERRAAINASSALSAKYPATVDEAAMQRAFVDRMRLERGLPAMAWSKEEWQAGDFEEFVPQIECEPHQGSVQSRIALWMFAIAAAAFCGSLWPLGLL